MRACLQPEAHTITLPEDTWWAFTNVTGTAETGHSLSPVGFYGMAFPAEKVYVLFLHVGGTRAELTYPQIRRRSHIFYISGPRDHNTKSPARHSGDQIKRCGAGVHQQHRGRGLDNQPPSH